jgi:hypothetical protein
MSLLLLLRPYRWRRNGSTGGARRKRDTVVFKIPKPVVKAKSKHSLKKKDTQAPVASDWTTWLDSAVKNVKSADLPSATSALLNSKDLIDRINLILRSVVMVPDGALLALEGPDPELLNLLSIISRQLEVYASDEEAVLLFMLQRRR